MIVIKSAREIKALQSAGQIVARTFKKIEEAIAPGVALKELDKIAESFILSKGAETLYKGIRQRPRQRPFPGVITTSVNNEICHAIPDKRILKNGDIIGIDIGLRYKGWCGDACVTYMVGKVRDDVRLLVISFLLPNEEMKGRIVGRNGRNIRAFEQAAGVDIIVDDTPEAVTISAFDPTRREIARRAMQRLIEDGRIHPAHIEKILAEEKDEVERIIEESGEQAAFDAGVSGIPTEVLNMLGRLKFRTSFGQNQLVHAVETARIAALIASELGADIEVARAGGLLHDIGKAMDHNAEGTHAQLGADYLKRHRVNPQVVNAVASHHHETDQQSIEAVIIEAADAISGARPGARRENLDQYIKRLKALEEMANAYDGVNQAYAIQAGREVRLIVEPDEIDDLEAARIARDLAKNIEETMQYPGQIKVTVIREMRAIEIAK